MDTRSIIEASATVITITRLKAGDVYKRLEPTSEPPLVFGIVQDVLHNGTDAAITAIEITSGYQGVSARLRVFEMAKDLALFAATPSELGAESERWIADGRRRLATAEKAVLDADEQLERLMATLASANLDQLTVPEYVVGSVVREQVEA